MWSQSCVVVMCTMFCLYIIKLKAIVTLTFNGLISKSIWIIYTPIQMSVSNLRNLGQIYLIIIRTRFGLYVNMLTVTVTLTFDRLTSKLLGIIYIPRRMSLPNVKKTSGQGLVYINLLMVTVTLTFD